MSPIKVLLFDIETSPMVLYSWGLHKQYHTIDQIIENPRMLCFASKWLGEKKVSFHSEWDEGREGMLTSLRDQLTEADVVGHYNGHTFDVPWVLGEMAREGISRPSPFQEVDLYRLSRQFRFPSHKLQYVSTALGLPGKVETGGFGLWKRVMDPDPAIHTKARREFKRYNIQDTRLLDPLWMALLPNMRLSEYTEPESRDCPKVGCPGRGSLQRRGVARTALGTFPQFWCKECNSWMRGKRAIQTLDMRGIA